MKLNFLQFFKFLFLGFFLFVSSFQAYAQQMEYTPYEELPAIEKILKPSYDDNMPDWAKMLYQYPVNFNEINKSYNDWMRVNPEAKNALTRYYKLWQMNLEPFADVNGIINIDEVTKIYKANKSGQILKSQAQRVSSAGDVSNWTFWGPKNTYWLNESGSATAPSPAPWQANVYSLDVTDAFPDIIFAGTETGFVNKSIDKGATWKLMNQNYIFGGGITAIAIDPTNTDIVYVSGGGAIHRTINGGSSWNKVSSLFSANRLKIDTSNELKIIASTDNGVWITTNRGTNWTKSTGTSQNCWDVEYKPNSPDTLYALTKNTANFFEIIQSNNGGTSFSKITTFPTNIPQVSGGMLAVTPANPNILWAVLLSKNTSNSELPYIYKGTLANGVWTWVLKYTGFTGLSSGSGLTNGQGYFDLVCEASPLNENILFAGTTSLYKTTNGGTTFTAVGGYQGNFSIHPDIQDMKMLSNGETWVATDGGMNYSSDGFVLLSRWKPLNEGLVGSAMWGFDQGWNEDIIVGGRYHNGNTAMADFYGDKSLRMGGGESPTGWLLKGKSRHAAFDDLGNGWILPKTAEGKPGGRFTFSKHPNMDGYGSYRTEVLTHPNYSGTLYVGSDSSMWKSTDFGVNYDLLYKFAGKIRFVGISTSNPDVMYADIIGRGFFRTGDGGFTWAKTTGTSAPSWTGEMMFAISPYNSDVIYAVKQHGAWGGSNSEVYKSVNAGGTWTQWSTLSKVIKYLVIQPTNDGKDLVYALSTSGNTKASAYFRKDGDVNWTTFDVNYPASTFVQAAAIFFRDSKLRVASNAGVWETPLAEPDFTPILVPWVSKAMFDCTNDTIQLDDHSLLNHAGATWNWEITPTPAFISDPNIRNPKVKVDQPGIFSVKMTVTKNDVVYSKTFENFFEVTACPTIEDCSNPGELPKNIWNLISVDSYQPGTEGKYAFDGDPTTIWHTAWSESVVHPHQIVIDLGNSYSISKMIHTPRPSGENGMIKDYELYISEDKSDWGTAQVGALAKSTGPSTVKFEAKVGRYVKLVALSEVNAKNWTSIGELDFVGCRLNAGTTNIDKGIQINAFPIPSNSKITITLPFNNGFNTYDYRVYSSTGQLLKSGHVGMNIAELTIDVMGYNPGYYFVHLVARDGVNYRVKFIKQ